jgi:hypothetical protein
MSNPKILNTLPLTMSSQNGRVPQPLEQAKLDEFEVALQKISSEIMNET